MRKFRVLLVVDLGAVAGTELSTLTLATGLKQAGHQVYVMCNPHPLVNEFTERGAEVILTTMERHPVELIKAASKMRRCIAENKIDIIHFSSALHIILVLLSWRTIKGNRAKVVWTYRGLKKISFPIVGHLFSLPIVDCVIANSDYSKRRLIKHGLSPGKITTIYNAPNITIPEDTSKNKELLKQLGIDSDTPIVGTASAFRPERGVKYFIEAAAIISRHIPKARFIIAGGGPLEKRLRQRVNDLNIEREVIFLGPRRDMENVYSIMDVFVNPVLATIRGGTGNTNAEAMASGKPVVATNVAGIPELVQNGITGILVPEKDPDSLARATLRLLRDRELAKKMGMAGRERVMSDFSLERLIREVEQVYSYVSRR